MQYQIGLYKLYFHNSCTFRAVLRHTQPTN